MYGTQASPTARRSARAFENDVKMYGTQARYSCECAASWFENDVKMYGTQADKIVYEVVSDV